MKKIVLTLTFLAGASFAGFAQKTQKAILSVGIDAGLVVGEVSDRANMIIGGSVKYDLPVLTKSFVTLSAGYSYLSYTNDYKIGLTGFTASQSSGEGYVPLKAGFKHFFCNTFYGEAQVGASISTDGGGGVGFAYAPGVGIKFTAVDFGIRYEAWSKTNTISQVALRLAYAF